jgi:hypothetical protein
MDFKVAGTKNGITAVQMDTKIDGISEEIFAEALKRAKVARIKILETITKTIKEPRKELSPFAPKIISFKINPAKIKNRNGLIMITLGFKKECVFMVKTGRRFQNLLAAKITCNVFLIIILSTAKKQKKSNTLKKFCL